MQISDDIYDFLKRYGKQESIVWLIERIAKISTSKSTKDLFMTYSLLASKFDANTIDINSNTSDNVALFVDSKASLLAISRIYLLVKILEMDADYFGAKVSSIIEVADTRELETFLKYLILLPNPEFFKNAAVEALRTNIATIFDAITLNNLYPAKYFNDQQWNQMYLKAAFMERDLSLIQAVDERANRDLSRIISDYAHERWAASRNIDPMFWRPATKFIDDALLLDMERLLSSDNEIENRAGGLCCFYSQNDRALKLLSQYPKLEKQVASKEITWNTLKK
ncbi:hypothetical protein BFP77_13865 [Maribacter sp. 4U21]|uniref:EboA domain-containing protein n=1 Tax=Maribacter sp. 4U21 TaxID=1889779 RepID=UPI000C15CB1F|nr:EboA domain-containing protein [Maribacter sp. 4U21]PIB27115.1 hypothetical protein BFP77_13865 [Maribacter sp. 4U21]